MKDESRFDRLNAIMQAVKNVYKDPESIDQIDRLYGYKVGRDRVFYYESRGKGWFNISFGVALILGPFDDIPRHNIGLVPIRQWGEIICDKPKGYIDKAGYNFPVLELFPSGSYRGKEYETCPIDRRKLERTLWFWWFDYVNLYTVRAVWQYSRQLELAMDEIFPPL